MDMEDRAEKAARLKRDYYYNCCQAVTAVLADETDLTGDQLNQISSGFAFGMGNMNATCGSLIGATMIAGLKSKGIGSVRIARQISEVFAQKTKAISCKDIKGRETGKVLCSCEDCVKNAVRAYCQVIYEK